MTPAGPRKLLTRISQAAAFPFPVHPHNAAPRLRLRASAARHDTRAIQEWLGHKNIQHTTRYTELTSHRFRDFWERED